MAQDETEPTRSAGTPEGVDEPTVPGDAAGEPTRAFDVDAALAARLADEEAQEEAADGELREERVDGGAQEEAADDDEAQEQPAEQAQETEAVPDADEASTSGTADEDARTTVLAGARARTSVRERGAWDDRDAAAGGSYAPAAYGPGYRATHRPGYGAAPADGRYSDSPLGDFEEDRPRRRRWPLVVLVVMLLLGGAYAAGAWFLGDKIPNGAVVAGVPVGGMAMEEAVERLDTDLGSVATSTIPVTAGEGITTIVPADVGLELDARATLEPLTGFSLDPRVLWGRLVGMGPVEPVTRLDEEALRGELESVAQDLYQPPVEGFITFDGARIEVTEPEDGHRVDVDDAARTIDEEWLTGERPLELPTEPESPEVDADDVETALGNLAEPLVSGPVAVSVGDLLAELSPEDLGTYASFTAADDGTLRLELDGEGLAETVTDHNPEIVSTGKDARIVLGEDGPEIIPSSAGTGIDPDVLAEAVLTAGTSSDRTAEVELEESEPDFTTEDAEALGVTDLLVDFSTPMPYDPVRTENLVEGASKVNGVLIMPGEEFSLLEHIAPVTEANGYVSSGVVEDGFVSTAVGGGLSQLSTNMFNIGFLAGMDDVTHTPHSRWFDRYPPGREATVWEGSIDMIWRNNTDYGVMVEAWVSDDRVHSRLWGTKVWEVRTETSDFYDEVEPTTVYNPAEECEPETGGKNGFTVTVTRDRLRDGDLVDEESWTTTYRPWNEVICGEEPE